MPTPGYLLNKYQRTLGSKTGLLQKRLAIEGDISAKKYAADQKKLVQGINIAGTVGAGLVEYSTAKKGGYTGGLMGYLGEKAKEHYGLDSGITTTTTSGGQTTTQTSSGGTGIAKTDYRVAFDAGVDKRKAAAGEWWENVKGLVPKSIGESKVGKHWRSEGKDFLKDILGIGKPKGKPKLQSGGEMTTTQQTSFSGSPAYSGEYGEHYEPEPYQQAFAPVKRWPEESEYAGLEYSEVPEIPAKRWPEESEYAGLEYSEVPETPADRYEKFLQEREAFKAGAMERAGAAKASGAPWWQGGGLNDLLLQEPMGSRRKPGKKLGVFNWGRE